MRPWHVASLATVANLTTRRTPDVWVAAIAIANRGTEVQWLSTVFRWAQVVLRKPACHNTAISNSPSTRITTENV
jgi:hypothetical protein